MPAVSRCGGENEDEWDGEAGKRKRRGNRLKRRLSLRLFSVWERLISVFSSGVCLRLLVQCLAKGLGELVGAGGALGTALNAA